MNPFGFVDPECLWEILIYQERNPRVLTLILIPFHLFAMCVQSIRMRFVQNDNIRMGLQGMTVLGEPHSEPCGTRTLDPFYFHPT